MTIDTAFPAYPDIEGRLWFDSDSCGDHLYLETARDLSCYPRVGIKMAHGQPMIFDFRLILRNRAIYEWNQSPDTHGPAQGQPVCWLSGPEQFPAGSPLTEVSQ